LIEPVAQRRLTLLPGGQAVTVELDRPREGRAGWGCIYRVRGLGRVRQGRVSGQDGVEALQLALVAVRRELEPFADRLAWTGQPGELGFPEPIPDCFGSDFRRRLEGMVHLATEEEARRLRDLAVGRPSADRTGLL
jgi:hypothetical protein